MRSVDWIFIVGEPAWRCLRKYVTLDKTSHSLDRETWYTCVLRTKSTDSLKYTFFLSPMPPHVLSDFVPPPRLWLKCNQLLRLGRPVDAVTLSRWVWWWNERWIWGARAGHWNKFKKGNASCWSLLCKLNRTFYNLLLVTGRIRGIGQNGLQSSFGNWAKTWHWTERFTVFFW